MKILGLTDLNVVGSGYSSLSLPIFDGLAKSGHDVKVIGLANEGGQHNFPFSIFPAKNAKEAEAIVHNLWEMWQFDVLVVMMDIPFHKGLLNRLQERPFKYVGVFPIEAGPLSFSWAMVLMQMDQQYVISEFGVEECHKKGIMSAQYLPVGIDLASWKQPTMEERAKVRSSFGFGDETFVVLTVADNQERKNLWASFRAFQKFSMQYPNSRYVVVTREGLFAGWNLQEMAGDLGIMDKLLILERGIPFSTLWATYAAADAFLLLSKAEGRGIPVTEAMAMGVPVVATYCTGIEDQIKDGRGIGVSWEYTHVDPFGNAMRYWADADDAANKLLWVQEHPEAVQSITSKAHEFVCGLEWKNTVSILEAGLKGLQQNEA